MVKFQISPDIARDVPLLTQSVGLSGLKPNCICLNFPTVASDREDYSFFYNTARQSAATDSALIVTKNIENFPATSDIVEVKHKFNPHAMGIINNVSKIIKIWLVKSYFDN